MSDTSAVKLMVVEDDRSVREMLSAVLEHEGFGVDAYADAEGAIAAFASRAIDLAILDIGLPGMDGLQLCEHARRSGYLGPLLMLTARHDVSDRVRGLDAGADDYLVKPFALDELLARVRAMLRRTTRSERAAINLKLGDLELDVETRHVRRGARTVELTKIEFELLHLLLANSPAVLTRDVIHERIWGYDAEHMSNSLEVFVSQLRRKLDSDGGERLIHTVRGVGYVARTG